jgi:H+/gluconate symporter-like permease
MWIGIFSFAMVALPGTPQIQNIIPASYFGTTTWAGVGVGLFATILFMASAMGWLMFRSKSLKSKGEGYGGEITQKQQRDRTLPTWQASLIPLLMVIVINVILSNPFNWSWGFHWDESSLKTLIPLNLTLLASSVGKIQAIWSISVALIVSSFAAAYIGRKRYQSKKENLLETINFGAASSCAAVLNVASGFAFGSVMVSLHGFLPIKAILVTIGDSAGPLVSAVVTTNIMCGITGSASGGLTIALSMLGEQWAQMATAQGISLEALHRIVSIASVGIDPVPHCGALVTLLAICGLTHKDSYFDIIVLLGIKFFIPFLCIVFYMITGIA